MGSLSKEIEDIQKNQMESLELKNRMTEIKNSMNGLNNRMEETEEIINPKIQEKLPNLDQNKTKQTKNRNTRNLWLYDKRSDICVSGVPEGDERVGLKKQRNNG